MRFPKLIATAVLVIAIAGMLAWLGGSTPGLRFLLARALPLVPGTVEIGQVEGRLVGPLALSAVRFEVPGARGTVDHISLDWRPTALVRRSVHLLDVRIETPRIELLPADGATPEADGDAGPSFELPLEIVVDSLVLRDGSLHTTEPLLEHVELELAGTAARRGIMLRHIHFTSDRGALSGHAELTLEPRAPWDVDLAWQLSLDDVALDGHARIGGALEALQVDLALDGSIEATVAGTITGLPAAPAWSLSTTLEPLPADGPWPETLAGLAGQLEVAGALVESRITGHVEAPAVLPGRVALDAVIGWVEGALELRPAVMVLADGARLEASGWLRPGEELAAELALRGTGLGWPLGDASPLLGVPRVDVRARGAGTKWQAELEGRVMHDALPPIDIQATGDWTDDLLTLHELVARSPDAEVRVGARGTLDLGGDTPRYRATADADVQLAGYPPVELEFAASGDDLAVEIEQLDARLLEGRVTGGGRIAWAGAQPADFRLSFTGLDPASLAPDLPGRVSGEVALRGVPGDPEGLEIILQSLAGELRDLDIDGAAAVNIAAETVTLRSARLSVGENTLEAMGRLDAEDVELQATLTANALAALHPGLRGGLEAAVNLTGKRDAPRLRLEARGQRLRWQANRARELVADVDLDLSGATESRLHVSVEGLATGPGAGRGAHLQLEGAGTPAAHTLRLVFDQSRPEQSLEVAVAGALAGAAWSGRIDTVAIAETGEPLWTLQAPAALDASAARVVLGEACMDGTLGLLCLDGSWQRDGPWQGHAVLESLDLGPLSAWLVEGLAAQGVVTGDVRVTAGDSGFQGLQGQIDLTAGYVRLAEEDSNPLVAWEDGQVLLEGDVAEARITLQLELAGADRVEGRLAVGWNQPDPRLDGALEAELAQLGLITELFPDLAELEGRATIQVAIGGSLGAPAVTARFEWRDGSAEIPALGLKPADIDVLASLEDGALGFTATGRSGEGRFEAEGQFDLTADAVEGRATLRGDGVLLTDLPEARVTASPDLQFTYTPQGLQIEGEVRIPFARITGLGGPTAVTTSQDEVIVGPRAVAEEEGLVVRSRVRVSVGPDVQVQAAGLRGRVEGSILTVIEPQALPWGRGTLRVVDGTFGAFGQRLEIETGRLIYTGGPLDNPGLEIRAVRRVSEITAGAQVRGTLREPEISVYSDPPLPSAEALSYLTMGKSLSELQSGEQRSVNQAANSLALSGGGLIAQDLGRRLGFDDVSVSADDDTGGTSVVVSKYLGSGLYVSYGLGLFDTVNTLRLRYQVNSRLSLEASSGDEAAADMFYTFERD